MVDKKMLAVMVIGVLLIVARVGAEEKGKDTPEKLTPVKVTVVFSEYEGEKKISNLPYTFPILSAPTSQRGNPVVMRMGLRVPFMVKGGESQYQDVGTNIDCLVNTGEADTFDVNLTLERNSVYSSGPEKRPVEWRPGEQPLAERPIFSGSKYRTTLLMRDGQTVQAAMSTDPVSGRVLKIDVTLTVVK